MKTIAAINVEYLVNDDIFQLPVHVGETRVANRICKTLNEHIQTLMAHGDEKELHYYLRDKAHRDTLVAELEKVTAKNTAKKTVQTLWGICSTRDIPVAGNIFSVECLSDSEDEEYEAEMEMAFC